MSSAAKETETANQNKDVVLRFMQLMDSHEFDKFSEVLASDLQLHLGQSHLDFKQTEDMIRMFYRAFPDWEHNVEEVLAVDDKVVLRATDRATHQGDFQEIAATGRRVTLGQIGIYRLVNGKIAEIWEEADVAALMQQIQAP
jgi:predicted ester cyclase